MPPSNTTNYSLTFQEVKIINYIKDGLSSQQIADKLIISIKTVKTHRQNIMKKVGLKGKTEFTQFVFAFTPPPISMKKNKKSKIITANTTKILQNYSLCSIVKYPTYR
jgi:DNA-binding CsgD family transcriptional regulator